MKSIAADEAICFFRTSLTSLDRTKSPFCFIYRTFYKFLSLSIFESLNPVVMDLDNELRTSKTELGPPHLSFQMREISKIPSSCFKRSGGNTYSSLNVYSTLKLAGLRAMPACFFTCPAAYYYMASCSPFWTLSRPPRSNFSPQSSQEKKKLTTVYMFFAPSS